MQILFLTTTQAQAAFDASSGEIHASALAGSARQGAGRADRLIARAHETAAAGWGLWGGVSGRTGSIDGDGNAAVADFGAWSFDLGIDYRGAGNRWATGAAFGYIDGDFSVDARNSRANYDGWHAGAYGRIGTGNAGFTGAASIDYASLNADFVRNISFGMIARTATGQTDIDVVSGAAELRYGLPIGGGWAAGPIGSVRFANSDLGSIDETGAQSLDLSSSGASDGFTRFGGGAFLNWQGPRGSIDLNRRNMSRAATTSPR